LISIIKFLFRAFRYRYVLDKFEIRYVLNNLKKGEVVIDVGAHKGGYLYWMSKKVGSKGKVIAFEPQAILCDYLKNLCKRLGLNNVTIENKGVSSVEQTTILYVPNIGKDSSPGATLNSSKIDKSDSEKLDIELITLNKYFKNHGEVIPQLIKVDVEGHELSVFKGCENILKENNVKLIFECEQRHLSNSGSIQEVFDYLNNLGYEGYFISKNGIKHISQFDYQRDQKNAWGKPEYVNNFIFEKKHS